MHKTAIVIVLVAIVSVVAYVTLTDHSPDATSKTEPAKHSPSGGPDSPYAGSSSCRGCHERFYELWSTSHHGLAMQPYTDEFAKTELLPQSDFITVNGHHYKAEIDQARVIEKTPDGSQEYPIVHVLGGKNVYYLLTPMEKGRLQVLPVAYDVRREQWYNTTGSMTRNFAHITDEAVNWKDSSLTFNTSCYGCHVSQLSTNYDPQTDTYHTEWVEPGINCETCHGPATEHIRIFREAEKTGAVPEESGLAVLTMKHGYTAHQSNANCAPCHAKMSPISKSFDVGEKYFDHYDLVTLEDHDFYPDGRDLGENYTYTLWRLSPCIKAGTFECMHCHTSSGRYRFHSDDIHEANKACLPCHQARVDNPLPHTHHDEDSSGSKCISCHMPMTEFARMKRSDHSMRPPIPAATNKYKSPNACNICHTDQDPNWSQRHIAEWHGVDYQKPILYIADLIHEAREYNWTRLDEMLAYLQKPDREEIYANSLVRLLRNCPREKKWPVLIKLLDSDSSPLVRSSIAESLVNFISAESLPALQQATQDEFRLVRIRAAASLAGVPERMIDPAHQTYVQRATEEYKTALFTQPDNWSAHYNLGNFYMNRNELDKAVAYFEQSLGLRPDVVPPMINAAMVYNAKGDNARAEKKLRRAIELEKDSVAAHLNLALLLGEQQRFGEAAESFSAVLKLDPRNAVAAYNLAIILSENDLTQALGYSQKAWQLEPGNHRYGYTHAFFLLRNNQTAAAIELLQKLVDADTGYGPVYSLLAQIYLDNNQPDKARVVFQKAANNPALPESDRYQFYINAQSLE